MLLLASFRRTIIATTSKWQYPTLRKKGNKVEWWKWCEEEGNVDTKSDSTGTYDGISWKFFKRYFRVVRRVEIKRRKKELVEWCGYRNNNHDDDATTTWLMFSKRIVWYRKNRSFDVTSVFFSLPIVGYDNDERRGIFTRRRVWK